MKANKEQLEKTILGIIFGIIAVVLLMTFVFRPSLNRIGILRAKIREEKTKILEAQKDIKDMPAMKIDYVKLEGKVKKYQLDMPQPTPDWLLTKLNTIAGDTGINYDKMEHRGYITQEGRYWLQGLSVELKTDYHTLGRFINKLENASPFLNIVDISIRQNPDDMTKHLVSLTVGAYVIAEK